MLDCSLLSLPPAQSSTCRVDPIDFLCCSVCVGAVETQPPENTSEWCANGHEWCVDLAHHDMASLGRFSLTDFQHSRHSAKLLNEKGLDKTEIKSGFRFMWNNTLQWLFFPFLDPLLPDLFLCDSLFYVLPCPLSPHFVLFPSGLDGAGGQRHHQLQATSHPAAGHPCQPVWLSHREGRGQDKGDQRGEQPEHKSTPSSLPSLNTEIWREPNLLLEMRGKLQLEGRDISFTTILLLLFCFFALLQKSPWWH